MWIEQLIIKGAEKKLQPYREQAEVFKQEFSDQYQIYVPHIITLYDRATHWHGTGRYHYQHKEDSRYAELHENKTVDILAAIVDFNGLKPHTDPWIDSGDKTVSLATTRMHARAFARIHTNNNDKLLYELGSIKYWLRFYFLLLLLWLFSNLRTHLPFIKSLFRSSIFSDIRTWAGALRKKDKNTTVSIIDIFRDTIPTSDIDGNYPILIGISADKTKLIETLPLTHKVEQRSLQPIKVEHFTHVEVPLQYVQETEDVLRKRGILLPVIPLEFGDAYLADKPLKTLAFSKHSRNIDS